MTFHKYKEKYVMSYSNVILSWVDQKLLMTQNQSVHFKANIYGRDVLVQHPAKYIYCKSSDIEYLNNYTMQPTSAQSYSAVHTPQIAHTIRCARDTHTQHCCFIQSK